MAPTKSPKPGGGTERDQMDQLLSMVNSLSLDADDKELIPVKDTATKAGTSEERLDKIVELFYQRCQEDWRFAPCCGRVCGQLASAGLEADGVKFRSAMLKRIQSDFANKDKLRSESSSKFLGCIAFLSQCFARMRNKDGEPLMPLVGPVIEGLELCLDKEASEEEMLCAAAQILVAGKVLQQCMDKTRFIRLKNTVKDKISHAVGTREVRLQLIDVVEAFASNWIMHCDTNMELTNA